RIRAGDWPAIRSDRARRRLRRHRPSRVHVRCGRAGADSAVDDSDDGGHYEDRGSFYSLDGRGRSRHSVVAAHPGDRRRSPSTNPVERRPCGRQFPTLGRRGVAVQMRWPVAVLIAVLSLMPVASHSAAAFRLNTGKYGATFYWWYDHLPSTTIDPPTIPW